MSTRCPVCMRVVPGVSDTTGHVPEHNDTAGHMCPMTGRHIPIEGMERRAV